MSEYVRIVSYINKYINGEKMHSCGFFRIDGMKNKVRVFVKLSDNTNAADKENTDGNNYKLYAYKNDENISLAVHIGDICGATEGISTTLVTDMENVGGSEYSLNHMSGMIIVGEDKGCIYVSEWEENTADIDLILNKIAAVNVNAFVEEEQSETKETLERQSGTKETLERQSEKGQIEIESAEECEHSEDFFEELSKRCVKIPAFNRITKCICIKPSDLVYFPEKYWKLAANSFLLGGYICHKFLIAGCCEYEGMTKYIIGVPGSDTERQKVLAEMFGFSVYLDAGRNKGYWCMYIDG